MMLKLVLQTQEGQQIEVTVGPDDTFTDLQRQYERPENPGLPELLKHLITNGMEVDENTKVFDYVTNSSSTEWLVEESLEGVGGLEQVEALQTIIEDTSLKDCCAKGCTNSEFTTSDKVFFPLPNDNDRLSAWLMGVGRPELVDPVMKLDFESRKKYCVCSDHFLPHQFLKGTNQLLKRRAYPSLDTISAKDRPNLSSDSVVSTLIKTELMDQPYLSHWIEEDESVDDPNNVLDNATEFLNEMKTDGNPQSHPGVLCRLCGEDAINPVYLYTSHDSESNLADKINLCLPITVNAMDPLPKQLCKDCHEKLDICHKLAVECLKAEDKLKAMYESKKFHIQDASDDVRIPQCPLCVCGNMQIIPKSGIYRKERVECDENLKNSSARTRQVTPSNCSKMTVSTCTEKNSIQGMDTHSLTRHAVEHDGYPCTICKDVTFKTKNEHELHLLKHTISQVKDDAQDASSSRSDLSELECERCGEKFPHVQALREHLCRISQPDDEWFECDRCGRNFSKKVHLHVHMKTHERRDMILYKCSSCSKQFPRKSSLFKHITSTHGDAKANVCPKCYKCKKCDEAFATLSDAESHVTDKHLNQLIMGDMNFMSEHFATEELNLSKVYMCEYCERCYTIPTSLHEHRQTEHTEIENYLCNICNSTFEKYKMFFHHKTLHRKGNDFEDLGIKQYYLCRYCNKTFLHYGTLSAHMSQHQKPLPYLCRLCNIHFGSYREVADHRETTHPYQLGLHEKPNNSFDCQYCEKNFTHEVALIKHIRMHTGERPHKCSICGKGFSQTSGLYTHLKVHSNLRPYTCTQCPRTFKIKGDRDNHVKKHSGERPYKCDFCEKAFMTQHVYSQHRKIHTNERPYKCHICGEAFRRSHVLTVHLRRHTGEKPHACDICAKTYRQRGDLLKHKKNQHSIRSINSINAVSTLANPIGASQNLTNDDASAVFLPI